MTTPIITPLPPAPTRADGAVDFTAKADTLVAALPPMIEQLNDSFEWQAEQLAQADSHRIAAAGSAQASAGSAAQSAAQVGLAAEQKGLAVQAREGAEGARDQALVYAQAAQTATVPAPVANKYLGSDSSGKVLWKEAGQDIGDILFTTKTSAPAGYVLADTVYTRDAHPELFAIIGTINQYNDAANFTALPLNVNPSFYFTSPYAYSKGKDNVWVLVGYISNTASTTSAAYRSSDGGATWVSIAGLTGKRSLVSVDSDGSGVWMAFTYDGYAYRSTDNGLTWSSEIYVSIGQGATPYGVTNRIGTWIANAPGSTYCAMSIDNGLNWVNNQSALNYNTITYAGAFYRSTGNAMERSADGVNWAQVLSSSNGYAPVLGSATLAVVYAPGLGSLLVSTDNGVTWRSVLDGTPIIGSHWNVDQSGVIYVRQVNTIAKSIRAKLMKSYDFGATWVEVDTPSAVMTGGFMNAKFDDAGNCLLLISASQSWRATRQYNYDVATQFRTPPVKVNRFQKAYIKAKAI